MLDWTTGPDRSTVPVQRIAQADLDHAPWLRGYRLPRRLPEDLSALPNLIDDLPGKAVATVYGEVNDIRGGRPASPSSATWERETVYFYGDDVRWRVLHMEDLGLPNAGWQGSDNYGAGELSPNGRWWAAASLRGSVVLDLKSGELHRGPAPQAGKRAPGTAVQYRWTADSQRVHVTNQGITPGEWAAAPDFDRLTLATGRIYPFAGGYLEPSVPDQKALPLTYNFFSNDGRLERAAIVGENILGEPFVYRDGGERYVDHGFLLAASSSGEYLGFLSSVAATGKNYMKELTVVDTGDGSVSARAQAPASLFLEIDSFDDNLWLLSPGWSGDERRPYPGIRHVWNADTGKVSKLTDLTLNDAEYRIFDFSYARDLIAADTGLDQN